MAKLRAIEYLGQPDKYPPKPVCVVFGDDLFLRRQVLLGLRHAVLGGDEGDFSLTTFEGPTAEFRTVAKELLTLAMFGSQRLVVVDEADEFVSPYREALEDYVARPGRSGILLLDVKSWPGNTRLAKAVDTQGLARRLQRPDRQATLPAGSTIGPGKPTTASFRLARRMCSSKWSGRNWGYWTRSWPSWPSWPAATRRSRPR